jgi:hypothetical protein
MEHLLGVESDCTQGIDVEAVTGVPGRSELPYEVLPVTGQRKSLKGTRLVRSYGHLKKGESKRYRERRVLLASGLYSDWPKYVPYLKGPNKRRENRRIAGYVTVFTTQKTGEKSSEVGISSP